MGNSFPDRLDQLIKVDVKSATVMGNSFPDRLDLLIKVDVKNATPRRFQLVFLILFT